MGWTILIVVLAALVALYFYVNARPDAFRVERRILINAPAEKIYPLVADFHQWTAWSPYEKLDPNLKRTYQGSASGLGAIYAYEGNNKVGAGRMEVVEASAPTRLRTKLEFFKPMKAINLAEFDFLPRDNGTEVTWAMSGQYNFMSKLFGTFMDFDKLVGGQFEEGLQNLKRTAEA